MCSRAAGRTSASARAVRALGARFGRPLPLDKRTLRALEETLQIAHQMWSGEVAPYRGNHYHLKEPLNSTQVLSRPHPPIMVVGMGERKALRLVAQYTGACNLFAFTGVDAIRHKLDG